MSESVTTNSDGVEVTAVLLSHLEIVSLDEREFFRLDAGRPSLLHRLLGLALAEQPLLSLPSLPRLLLALGGGAFGDCGELTEVTMLGERPEAPKDLFPGCGKLKSIHVPANAKSWAGMKEWQGIPLVFDGEGRAASEKGLNSGNATAKDVPKVE